MTLEDFFKIENIFWVARNSSYDLDKLVDELLETIVLTKKQKRDEEETIRKLAYATLYAQRYGRRIG